MVAEEFISQGFQLPLPLAVLLVGGLVTPLVGLLAERLGMQKLREIWMVLVTASALGSVYLLYQQLTTTAEGIMVIAVWGQKPPLAGCFEIDMLSVFMAGSIAFLGFLAVIYSVSYMEKETRLTEFYTLVAFMLAGMMGVSMAGDFFTLFVFWELMGLSSYVLVAFLKRTWGPIEAGFKYLVMSATAGAFLILSMAIIYGMTGTLNFAALADSLRGASVSPWIFALFSTLVVGFGVKSAIVPLHTWLPDAHPEAPSPISALLSGIVIETGLYALTRVLFISFEPGIFKLPMAFLAVLTMTLANVMALLQSDIKRLLAYSSIAQIGYMLVGLAAGTAYGAMGLFLHVFNHSMMKGMAFLAAGSIVHETGTRDLKSFRGVGKMMPITSFSLFITLLGLGGVPGTNGFISKYHLFSAAFGSGLGWLGIMGVLNSALSMAYYIRIMQILLGSPEEGFNVHEAPIPMVAVTLVMAVIIVFLGIWPAPIINFATKASEALVNGLSTFIGAVLG
jgi:proton-translocating NADH-quinone oxidoreductase chain N